MSVHSQEISILYVEDEDSIREGYAKPLQRISKQLYIAKDGQEGLELYKEYKPDIIVSDIKMPLMNGIDMAKEIEKIDPNMNIIFTTAHSESAYLLEAIELRVKGYLLKPVQKKSLIILIEKISKNIRLEEENIRLREELANMAYRDGLTNIYNRNRFEEFFMREEERFKRYQKPVSIALLDIDHFKSFNDNYGHLIGDEVLILLANAINQRTRKLDVFARWGGEEFVILFSNTDIDTAFTKSEKIRELISNLEHPIAGTVTASFGLATLKENDSLQTLLSRADNALYKAKGCGRNVVIKED